MLLAHSVTHDDCYEQYLAIHSEEKIEVLWLLSGVLQHNTCPVCRKTLGTPAAEPAADTNVDFSDSSESSDSDDNSNISNGDSAVNASSSVGDAEGDRTANESTTQFAAADLPDYILWDMQPNNSTLSDRAQQDDRPHSRSRHRSSDSSSSEYSSL